MSTGVPTLDPIATPLETSALAQEADKVSVDFGQGVGDSGSFIWRQIDDVLRRSLERSGFRQPDVLPREDPPPRKHVNAVVVAPGIMVLADEYEKRYGGIDLEQFRQRMSSDLFKAFVRHIGSIPG